jgi:hypothetical protein
MIVSPGAKAMRLLLISAVLSMMLAVGCGSAGLPGLQGPVGDQGPQGAQGWVGDEGAPGPLPTSSDVMKALQPMATKIIPQLKGGAGFQGPDGPGGAQGLAGVDFRQSPAGIMLDQRSYAVGTDTTINVYGSGFVRNEFVLPQIAGANPRGFAAAGVNADIDGVFSTTITLNTSGHMVKAGVYSLQINGGEGTYVTIPIVISE